MGLRGVLIGRIFCPWPAEIGGLIPLGKIAPEPLILKAFALHPFITVNGSQQSNFVYLRENELPLKLESASFHL